MQYTEARPKTPGWYWQQSVSTFEERVVEVRKLTATDGLGVVVEHTGGKQSLQGLGAYHQWLWAGPIARPTI